MMEEGQSLTPDQLLKLGIQAVKAGNKETARVLFQQVLDQDRRNERALLWMASVLDAPEERMLYLRAVLKVNPHNKTAKKNLEKLEAITSAHDRRLVRTALIAFSALIVVVILVVIVALVLSTIF